MTNTPMPPLDARAVRYARAPETDEELSMSYPERLSATLDAEASAADLDRLLAAMAREPALMDTWARQVAASDVLSRRDGVGRAPAGFAAGVMGAIAAAEAGTTAPRSARVVPLAARRPTGATPPRPATSPSVTAVATRGPIRRTGARRRFAAALSGVAAAATLCVGAGYWLGQSRPALAEAVPTPGAAVAAPAGGGTVWAYNSGGALRTVSERTDYTRNGSGWQHMADAGAAPMDAAAAAQLSRLLMNHAAARAEHGGMMGSALVYVRDNARAGGCPAQAAC